MRSQPAFDVNLGSSHAQMTRVDLHAPRGAFVATLPIDGGSISEQAGSGWSGSVTLVGQEWAPDAPDHPLAGFSGHWVRVWLGQVVNQQKEWLAVAELLISSSSVRRTPEGYEVTVTLTDVMGWAENARDRTFRVTLGQNCNQAIRQVLNWARPRSWAGLAFAGSAGSSTPVPVSYHDTDKDPLGMVEDLSAFANVNVRARWDRTVVIEGPRGQTPGPVVRTLDVATDIESLDVATGRGTGSFANRVELTFSPVGDIRGRTQLRSDWTYSTATSGAPAAGEIRLINGKWRLHYKDRDGDQMKRQLRKVEPGSLVRFTANNGWVLVGEVTEAEDIAEPDDNRTFVRWTLDTIDTEESMPGNGARIRVTAWPEPEDPVLGVAQQTDGPLGVNTVGRVTLERTYDGNVSQAVANARAAQVLPRMLAGWATTVAEIVPDPRLQVDDTVNVRYLDGTTVKHRITQITYPLDLDTPMRVGLRTYDLASFTRGV